MSKQLKNIGVVSGLTVVSRVLGLFRDALSAAVFGASALNSAFVTAFRIPNLFRRLLGEGSLTAAFIPTLQHELHGKGRDSAYRLVNEVASWTFVVTTGLVALGMFACAHARLLTGHEERWYLSADLSVFLFPYLVFVCVAAVYNATLNVMQRFTESALSPVLLNVTMIVTLGGAGLHWASSPMGEMYWLCAGVLIGGVLQMLLPAVALFRRGWRPRFLLSWSPGVREIAWLMAPGLWGAAIYQVNLVVIQLLAMSLNDWAATLLFYAGRITELPIGVFAIAVSTVVYPAIAEHAARGDYKSMASDYLRGMRMILVINVPAAAGLAMLSEPIVRVLFQRGHFSAHDTHILAPLIALSVIGLPFFSAVSMTTRAFYALKDTATPVRVATVSFFINLGLSLLLMHPLGTAGLVVASTTAVVIQCATLQVLLARRVREIRMGLLVPDLLKIAVGALAMSAVVAAGWWGWLRSGGLRADLVALGALIPAGTLVYGAVLWMAKIGGREEFAALLGKLRARLS